MIKKITDKDKKDWQDFLSSTDTLENKDKEKIFNKVEKIKSVDLHGFTLDQANRFIEKLIKESYKKGIRKLIVITGKGIHSNNEKDPYKSKDLSILKYSVPEFIRNNSGLMKIINDIENASIEDGGGGAFYVYLRKTLIIYNFIIINL